MGAGKGSKEPENKFSVPDFRQCEPEIEISVPLNACLPIKIGAGQAITENLFSGQAIPGTANSFAGSLFVIVGLLFFFSTATYAFSPWDEPERSQKQEIITSLPAIAGISVIRFYQTTISPQLRPNKCNFTPSCSNYALQAIKKYGGASGMVMAFERLSRDHPWAWEEGYAVKNGRLVDEP